MISIIVPVYNEADVIAQNIAKLRNACGTDAIEIIVVDGGSSDDTLAIAKTAGVIVVSSEKGRAKQMNAGAAFATGELLYFVHADSLPPFNFDQSILNAIEAGALSGCFRLAFDIDHWFLKANVWFTRFDVNAIRFGDQSLFVLKQIFKNCGGYNEGLFIMEDQEIIHRIKLAGKFVVIDDYVTTSARKYEENGIYNMQAIFFRIWALYYLGYSQERILRVYKKLISKHKL